MIAAQESTQAARLLVRAREASRQRRSNRAVALCDAALNAHPSRELATALRLERAQALADLGDFAAAERDCVRAITEEPSARGEALLARCELERNHDESTVERLERVLECEGDDASHWLLYAHALSRRGRHDAALRAAERFKALDQGLASALLYSEILAHSHRHEAVIAAATNALTVWPHSAELWRLLGVSESALGHPEATVRALTEAVTREPARADAHCALGFELLRLGRFGEGFRENEHRQAQAGAIARYGVRAWQGESLTSAHLLVLPEQGLGDIIQFARFVPFARARAGRLTFVVPRPLVRVLNTNAALNAEAVDHPGFGAADFQTLLMSLPHRLGVNARACSLPEPLLRAEPERVERWRAKLPGGRKIAFAWQGNPNYAGEPWRSIPLARLAPLFGTEGRAFTWISLQKYVGRDALRDVEAANVLDLGGAIDAEGDAFVDSLAILSLVELFVTSDTALAHLAGSAHIPTLLLVSHVPDWRWGLRDERTLWYPSVRLLRQPRWNDWDAVVTRVAQRLFELT